MEQEKVMNLLVEIAENGKELKKQIANLEDKMANMKKQMSRIEREQYAQSINIIRILEIQSQGFMPEVI